MSDHLQINRDYWNAMAQDWVAGGERLWAAEAPRWGIWAIPESQIAMLPADMSGMSAVELGCGTAYVSAWMARAGARVTGVDQSAGQLATARRLMAAHGADLTLLEANAEATGLPDGAFDFTVSEYGAAIWCDPDLWLPEAWRLLRPGGRLHFLGTHPLAILTTPETGEPSETTLHRDYTAIDRLDWTNVPFEPGGVEFNRTFSGWLALFRRIGFVVEDYQEILAPPEATDTVHFIPAAWAKRFPSEQVWKLRKPG